jgi:23S rRNA pseudouridine2605 synthase
MKERLQKIISAAGVASRRQAEALIVAGEVAVNGRLVKELGTKADITTDMITVSGKHLKPSLPRLYIALHKPVGYISTLVDPQGRKTVKDLLPSLNQRVFPIGRLDYDSEGLILLTNDGDFAFRVGHPKFRVPKRYWVKVKGGIGAKELEHLKNGIQLEDGEFKAVDVALTRTNPKSSWVLVTIEEGRNRIIRRAFAVLNWEIKKLVRVAIGAITIEGIKPGEYRYISKREVDLLLRNSKKHRLQ